MQESSKGASSLSVERKTTQTSSGSRVNDGPKLSTSNGHDSLRMGLKLVTSNGHDGCVARTNSSGFNTGVVESEVEQKVSLVHNRPSDKSKGTCRSDDHQSTIDHDIANIKVVMIHVQFYPR